MCMNMPLKICLQKHKMTKSMVLLLMRVVQCYNFKIDKKKDRKTPNI